MLLIDGKPTVFADFYTRRKFVTPAQVDALIASGWKVDGDSPLYLDLVGNFPNEAAARNTLAAAGVDLAREACDDGCCGPAHSFYVTA